tara:strand:+ start:22 stop:249 length:228 start_codon:yes stop_codon:yes gene_type:complete
MDMTKNPFLELSIDELAVAWNNYSNLHGEDALDLESKAWLEDAIMENIGLLVNFWPTFRYGVKKKKVSVTLYPRK